MVAPATLRRSRAGLAVAAIGFWRSGPSMAEGTFGEMRDAAFSGE